MAYRLNTTRSWNSGGTTPLKYTFFVDVEVDVVQVVNNVATISIVGTYGATDYSTNTSNVNKASDFAIVAPGDADAWNYQFTPGVEYYEATLPVIPNAPADVQNKVLIEFRGDTWRSDPTHPGNRASLYQKGSGVVLDGLYAQGETRTFNINTTFDIAISSGGSTPILAYVASGWEAGPLYEWLDHEVLVSWIDLDYVPDCVRDENGVWLSHNRSGGDLKMYDGTKWSTNLKTVGDGDLMGDPPSIYSDGKFYNRRRLGKE